MRVEEGASVLERLTGQIPTKNLRPSWLVFSQGFNESRLMRRLKYMGEFVMALVACAFALPLMGQKIDRYGSGAALQMFTHGTITALLRQILVGFVRDEVTKVGVHRGVLGLSGGIDSAHPVTMMGSIDRRRLQGKVRGGGPLIERSRELAASSAAGNRIIVTGPRSDLSAVYSACDACVLCSDSETLPLSPMEAQACEVPVVCMRVGGVEETMVPGETGALVAQGDVDGMALALLASRGGSPPPFVFLRPSMAL